MELAKDIADLPDELWQRLRTQTDEALTKTNSNDFKFFKLIYKDSITSKAPVLTEYHLLIDWEGDNYQDIKDKLVEALEDIPVTAPMNISFASVSLQEGQSLANVGAAYADKIYFNVGDPEGRNSFSSNVRRWSQYFQEISERISNEPTLYERIVQDICRRLEDQNDIAQWSPSDWKLLLLARNLPEVYANNTVESSVLQTTRQLTNALETAIDNENVGLAYHIINILEWLAYLKTRMFEGFDLDEGEKTRQSLARVLLHATDPETKLPGRIRQEAAWAIGWASVPSSSFGREVYGDLVRYEQLEQISPIALTIRCAELRSFIYPTPYVTAANTQQAGWFQAQMRDEYFFRKLAQSGDYASALEEVHNRLRSGMQG